MNTKWTFLSALTLLGLTALHGAPVWNCENIRQLEQGQLSIRPTGGSFILDEDFKAPNAKWKKPNIYGDYTRITHKVLDGVPCVYIERNPERQTKPGEKFDVAWELHTVNLPLPQNAHSFVLNMKVRSNNERMRSCWGHGDAYRNQILWFDKDGKRLAQKSGYQFNVAPGYPAEKLIEGMVPTGAAFAQLQIGCDLPDLEPGQFVAISKASLQILSEKPDYFSQAYFTTSAIPLQKGKVQFQGTESQASSIAFQVSTTTDIHGLQNTWTPFAGPDGRADSWYANGTELPVFPKDAVFFRMRVRLMGNQKESPVVTGLTVGSYRDNNLDSETLMTLPHAVRISQSPVQDVRLPFKMTLKGADGFVPSVVRLLLNDKDATGFTTYDRDICTVMPPEGFQKGLNFITVEMKDAQGNQATEEMIHYVGELRKSGIVTLRDDGLTLIDGKPFFPIGMACVVKDKLNGFSYDNLFKMFKDCGMNCARNYSGFNMTNKEYPEFAAAAQKHDIKLYMAASTEGACDKDIRRVARSIVRQKELQHIVWDIGDDTSAFVTPNEMENRYQTCTAIDPTRLTIQEDGVGKTYASYAAYTEVFAPEIYPFHGGDVTREAKAVPVFISDLKAIKNAWKLNNCPPRSTWPLIGYFYNCSDDDRLPTPHELRAMTYQCIIHGAKGIIFYRYGGYRNNASVGFKTEEWNVVANMARELRGFYDVLCDHAAAWQPAVTVTAGPKTDVLDNTAVSALLQGTGAKKTLFTASSVREKTTARITVPSGTRSVTDAFTKKNVAIVNGAVTIDFAPLGVNIFVIE